MIYRSQAPLRISFAGGGTDVSPYPETRGGAVLSTTIDMYAYASAEPRTDGVVRLKSLDLHAAAEFAEDAVPPPREAPSSLALLAGAVRATGVPAGGVTLTVHSDASPGSGLGSSSSVVVAALGALCALADRPLGGHDLAELAYRVERVDCGIKGGRQDQYAAVFGGLNFIRFGPEVAVEPLMLPRALLLELHHNLLLGFTGKTRVNRNIIGTQQEAYRSGAPRVTAALDRLRDLAVEMRGALAGARLDDFARLMSEGWEQKKRLAPGITDPHIDLLYAAAIRSGAVGGKLLGAGGGGYLLLYCPQHSAPAVTAALSVLGGRATRFCFSERGLETWRVEGR